MNGCLMQNGGGLIRICLVTCIPLQNSVFGSVDGD